MVDYDKKVFEIYENCVLCKCSDSHPNLIVNSDVFSNGNGRNLYKRLLKWLDNGSNNPTTLLKDYFNAGISDILTWKPELISKGNVFLSDYAWDCFLLFVNEQGGRKKYIIPSPDTFKKTKNEIEQLNYIQSFRDIALIKGDLLEYDILGEMIMNESIEYTYNYIKPITKGI